MSGYDDYPEPEWVATRTQPNRGRQTQGRGSQGGGRFKKNDRGKYVEVDQRILEFYQAFPDGRLESGIDQQFTRLDEYEVQERTVTDDNGRTKTSQIPVYRGVVTVWAKAYRTPDDPHPGTGHSWIIMPGRTPYTLQSELENAETSAWGRAIAACGIAVREGIATRQEIDNKRGPEDAPGDDSDGQTPPDATQPAAAVPVAPSGISGEARGTGGIEAQGKDTEAIARAVPTAVAVSSPAMSFELFMKLCRERFIQSPTIAAGARALFGEGVGSIKALTNEDRERLWALLSSGEVTESQQPNGESTISSSSGTEAALPQG